MDCPVYPRRSHTDAVAFGNASPPFWQKQAGLERNGDSVWRLKYMHIAIATG